MKAVKTASGKWKARYVDHYEYTNGKRKIVLGTVTRSTKREAIKEATRLEGLNQKGSEMTVAEALERYIAAKDAVLSPSTIKGYKALQANAYEQIASVALSGVSGERLQTWVSKYATKHTPKATRNAYALLCAAVKMFAPTVNTAATLPRPKPPQLYTPTDADVKILLAHTKGTDMEKAVILAALGTLRRGEICALRAEDIVDNSVRVTKAVVEKSGGGTAEKGPKTVQSIRTVTLPPSAIAVLRRGTTPGSPVVNLTPTAISNAFPRVLKECGLPSFRFHDLRAYSASVRHALQIPDVYIMQAGGWKSPRVLQACYRRPMADKANEFEKIANDHFEGIMK